MSEWHVNRIRVMNELKNETPTNSVRVNCLKKSELSFSENLTQFICWHSFTRSSYKLMIFIINNIDWRIVWRSDLIRYLCCSRLKLLDIIKWMCWTSITHVYNPF